MEKSGTQIRQSPWGGLERAVEPVLAGIVAGEIAFTVFFASSQSDFWQHYESANAVLRQLPIRDYNYLAATAVLFVPLAFLPARVAQLAWLGINYLAFALAFRFMPTTRPRVLAWLAWPPIFISAAAGQIDCLVLLSVALAWCFYDHKRDLEAGIALGLGLVKVHLLVPFLILGVLTGRRRWLAGFLPVALVFGLVSALLPQSYPERIDFVLSWYVQNPRGLGLPSRVEQLSIVNWLGLVVLLGLAWLIVAIKKRHLAWLTMPLVHPYFPMYDLALIAPAMATGRFVLLFYVVIGVGSLHENELQYVTLGVVVLLIVEFWDLLRQRHG